MTKFEEELSNLPISISTNYGDYWNKAQLLTVFKDWQPQQALPVVPEFVGIWIKKCQELNWMITDVLAPESWSSDFAKDTEKWLKDSKENFNLLALAFITGKYQVEKPQLFYLKNKLTTSYLALDINTGYYEHWGEEIIPKLLNKQGYKTSFTQQEIDSMQTESYELVPVEDGE